MKIYSKQKQRALPVIKDTYFNGKNLWLIKPISFNRGRGI